MYRNIFCKGYGSLPDLLQILCKKNETSNECWLMSLINATNFTLKTGRNSLIGTQPSCLEVPKLWSTF